MSVLDTTGYQVEVQINGVVIDPALVIADVTIRSGRTRQDDGIEPATATIELVEHAPTGLAVGIAQQIAITVDAGDGPQPRFAGRVTEMTRTPTAGEDGSTWTIVGAGHLSRLARYLITLPLPAETAAARAQRVISAVGFVPVIQGGAGLSIGPYGVVDAGQPPAPPATADQILGDLINDTGVVVADLGDGSILVQFADGRLSEDRWTPDPAITNAELAFAQTDDVINDVQLTWTGGSVAVTSPGSIADYQHRAISMDTALSTLAAAQSRANSIIARLAYPAWAIEALTTYDRAFFDHGIGALVDVGPIPASAPVESPWQGVMEGWTEHYQASTDGTDRILGVFVVALGDTQHSAEVIHWAGVTPTLHWNGVDPATAWNEAISNAALTP